LLWTNVLQLSEPVMNRFVIVASAIVVSSPLYAQDATTTRPQKYTLLFENEWVKVTRVHYAPHAKLGPHAHTTFASAYVYLNDGGPVIFRHVGGHNTAATRPPTIAGGLRLFRGIDEIHEVENLSAQPSHFLRVEFKTDPGDDPRSLRGKFLPMRDEAEMFQKVHFENAQLRVTRIFVPAGRSTDVTAAAYSTLLVWLTDPRLGAVGWLVRGQTERIVSSDSAFVEALGFELKTAPR
jgi:hypothetical protein